MKPISKQAAARRIGKTGMQEAQEDIQSFWNDVYTEAIEAGEDVELTIVQPYKNSGKYGPAFIADEVYYWAIETDDGIEFMTEEECELAHVEDF